MKCCVCNKQNAKRVTAVHNNHIFGETGREMLYLCNQQCRKKHELQWDIEQNWTMCKIFYGVLPFVALLPFMEEGYSWMWYFTMISIGIAIASIFALLQILGSYLIIKLERRIICRT
jgi:hypothetical protein